MRSHFEYQNRKRQQQPQPEASCHVVKFITRPRGCRSYERLQCHSTDRTASGTTAAYLRVHRTCPHTFRILFFRLVVRLFYLIRADFVMIVVMVMGMFTGIFGKITIGMGFKFTLTAGGAEIKLVVLVSNAAVRPVGQDGHPAHGISTLCNTWPSSGDNVCSEAVWLLCCTALSFFTVTLLMHTEASSVFRVCHGCHYHEYRRHRSACYRRPVISRSADYSIRWKTFLLPSGENAITS